MHVIEATNSAAALPKGVHLLINSGLLEKTRAGPCLVAPGPVVTRLKRPWERVVFSKVRDANPFFHVVEAIWMLAGRDDAETLNHYVTDFGERFAESASGSANWEAGGQIHGAYGHRWRFRWRSRRTAGRSPSRSGSASRRRPCQPASRWPPRRERMDWHLSPC